MAQNLGESISLSDLKERLNALVRNDVGESRVGPPSGGYYSPKNSAENYISVGSPEGSFYRTLLKSIDDAIKNGGGDVKVNVKGLSGESLTLDLYLFKLHNGSLTIKIQEEMGKLKKEKEQAEFAAKQAAPKKAQENLKSRDYEFYVYDMEEKQKIQQAFASALKNATSENGEAIKKLKTLQSEFNKEHETYTSQYALVKTDILALYKNFDDLSKKADFIKSVDTIIEKLDKHQKKLENFYKIYHEKLKGLKPLETVGMSAQASTGVATPSAGATVAAPGVTPKQAQAQRPGENIMAAVQPPKPPTEKGPTQEEIAAAKAHALAYDPAGQSEEQKKIREKLTEICSTEELFRTGREKAYAELLSKFLAPSGQPAYAEAIPPGDEALLAEFKRQGLVTVEDGIDPGMKKIVISNIKKAFEDVNEDPKNQGFVKNIFNNYIENSFNNYIKKAVDSDPSKIASIREQLLSKDVDERNKIMGEIWPFLKNKDKDKINEFYNKHEKNILELATLNDSISGAYSPYLIRDAINRKVGGITNPVVKMILLREFTVEEYLKSEKIKIQDKLVPRNYILTTKEKEALQESINKEIEPIKNQVLQDMDEARRKDATAPKPAQSVAGAGAVVGAGAAAKPVEVTPPDPEVTIKAHLARVEKTIAKANAFRANIDSWKKANPHKAKDIIQQEILNLNAGVRFLEGLQSNLQKLEKNPDLQKKGLDSIEEPLKFVKNVEALIPENISVWQKNIERQRQPSSASKFFDYDEAYRKEKERAEKMAGELVKLVQGIKELAPEKEPDELGIDDVLPDSITVMFSRNVEKDTNATLLDAKSWQYYRYKDKFQLQIDKLADKLNELKDLKKRENEKTLKLNELAINIKKIEEVTNREEDKLRKGESPSLSNKSIENLRNDMKLAKEYISNMEKRLQDNIRGDLNKHVDLAQHIEQLPKTIDESLKELKKGEQLQYNGIGIKRDAVLRQIILEWKPDEEIFQKLSKDEVEKLAKPAVAAIPVDPKSAAATVQVAKQVGAAPAAGSAVAPAVTPAAAIQAAAPPVATPKPLQAEKVPNAGVGAVVQPAAAGAGAQVKVPPIAVGTPSAKPLKVATPVVNIGAAIKDIDKTLGKIEKFNTDLGKYLESDKYKKWRKKEGPENLKKIDPVIKRDILVTVSDEVFLRKLKTNLKEIENNPDFKNRGLGNLGKPLELIKEIDGEIPKDPTAWQKNLRLRSGNKDASKKREYPVLETIFGVQGPAVAAVSVSATQAGKAAPIPAAEGAGAKPGGATPAAAAVMAPAAGPAVTPAVVPANTSTSRASIKQLSNAPPAAQKAPIPPAAAPLKPVTPPSTPVAAAPAAGMQANPPAIPAVPKGQKDIPPTPLGKTYVPSPAAEKPDAAKTPTPVAPAVGAGKPTVTATVVSPGGAVTPPPSTVKPPLVDPKLLTATEASIKGVQEQLEELKKIKESFNSRLKQYQIIDDDEVVIKADKTKIINRFNEIDDFRIKTTESLIGMQENVAKLKAGGKVADEADELLKSISNRLVSVKTDIESYVVSYKRDLERAFTDAENRLKAKEAQEEAKKIREAEEAKKAEETKVAGDKLKAAGATGGTTAETGATVVGTETKGIKEQKGLAEAAAAAPQGAATASGGQQPGGSASRPQTEADQVVGKKPIVLTMGPGVKPAPAAGVPAGQGAGQPLPGDSQPLSQADQFRAASGQLEKDKESGSGVGVRPAEDSQGAGAGAGQPSTGAGAGASMMSQYNTDINKMPGLKEINELLWKTSCESKEDFKAIFEATIDTLKHNMNDPEHGKGFTEYLKSIGLEVTDQSVEDWKKQAESGAVTIELVDKTGKPRVPAEKITETFNEASKSIDATVSPTSGCVTAYLIKQKAVAMDESKTFSMEAACGGEQALGVYERAKALGYPEKALEKLLNKDDLAEINSDPSSKLSQRFQKLKDYDVDALREAIKVAEQTAGAKGGKRDLTDDGLPPPKSDGDIRFKAKKSVI